MDFKSFLKFLKFSLLICLFAGCQVTWYENAQDDLDKKISATVKFIAADESLLKNPPVIEKTYKIGQSINLLQFPLKQFSEYMTGATFTGWTCCNQLGLPLNNIPKGVTVDKNGFVLSYNVQATNAYFIANWEVDEKIKFIIDYYFEGTDEGNYKINSELQTVQWADDYESLCNSIILPEYAGFEFLEFNNPVPIDNSEDFSVGVKFKRKTINLNFFKYADDEVPYATVTGKYGYPVSEEIEEPAEYGMKFLNWQENHDGILYDSTIPETFPDEDKDFYGNWLDASHISYKIKLYLENAEDGDFTIADSITKNDGVLGESTSISADEYSFEGFGPGEFQNIVIDSTDEEKIIPIKFKRNIVKLSFYSDGSLISEVSGKYGSSFTNAPDNPEKIGAIFMGWKISEAASEAVDLPETFPAENTIFYSGWLDASHLPYQIKLYLENPDDDGFTLVDTISKNDGVLGESTSISTDEYSFEGFGPGEFQNIVINSTNEEKIIPIKFKRNIVKLSFYSDGSLISEVSGKYGSSFTNAPDNPVKTEYTFKGWKTSEAATETVDLPETFPLTDTSFYADWKLNTYGPNMDFIIPEIINYDDNITLNASSLEIKTSPCKFSVSFSVKSVIPNEDINVSIFVDDSLLKQTTLKSELLQIFSFTPEDISPSFEAGWHQFTVVCNEGVHVFSKSIDLNLTP